MIRIDDLIRSSTRGKTKLTISDLIYLQFMDEDQRIQHIKLSVPGEWAAEKLLGPLFGDIGDDISSIYALSKENAAKIVIYAYKKVKDKSDKKKINARVARDVFLNGSYADSIIAAEYFGGVLASSRSEDGQNDRGIFYVGIIKSLSSSQLHLHYIIYHKLNDLLRKNPIADLNVGLDRSLDRAQICFNRIELMKIGIDIEVDPIALEKNGLIRRYDYNSVKVEDEKYGAYVHITPTTLGIQLYAVASNQLENWRKYGTFQYPAFPDVPLPENAAKDYVALFGLGAENKGN